MFLFFFLEAMSALNTSQEVENSVLQLAVKWPIFQIKRSQWTGGHSNNDKLSFHDKMRLGIVFALWYLWYRIGVDTFH